MDEHKLYQEDKLLWACLLFMKYTHHRREWEGARKAVKDTLGEEGMERLTKAWKQAHKEGLA